MANVAIYYQQQMNETTKHAVYRVNLLIEKLEIHHVILGVRIDTYNQSTELMELLNSPLSDVDYIYINKPIKDDFDKTLINQLSRNEKFEICFFDEI